MKIGLLVCDHIKENYRAIYGDYPQMFSRLFPDYKFLIYNVVDGEFPRELGQCNAYMATGSRHAVYHEKIWIQKLLDLVREIYKAKIPFVGYCFGHQLIGQALGGHVEKQKGGWCIGLHKLEINNRPTWIEGKADQLRLLMMCEDQIVDLPPNSKVIAGDASCKIGIIQVGDHFLGIQGHPEFGKDYNRVLIEERKVLFSTEKYNQGINSLHSDPDSYMIRDWVKRFISANANSQNQLRSN